MTTGIWIAGTISVALIICFAYMIRHIRKRHKHERASEWLG